MAFTPGSSYVPAMGFARLTPYYDAVVARTMRERTFRRALIRQAEVGPGQRVLDLASGTGTLAVWLARDQPGAQVTGVDGDPAVLAIARAKAQRAGVRVGFDQALCTALPYPDGHFDRAVSSLLFHHLSLADKNRTARELFRVMKPGGTVHIADWGPPANVAMRVLFLAIQLLDGFENTQDSVTGRLVGVLAEAGFERVVARQSFGTLYGTLTLYSARRPVLASTATATVNETKAPEARG